MRVFLVRHTSVDVPQGVCYGETDVPLRGSFPEEAEVVKRNLQRIVEVGLDGEGGVKFDAVFTSPLSRCTRLADFCGYRDAVRENRVMEINFGEWEMCRYDTNPDPRLQEWYDDYLHVRATGGESFQDQFNRVKEFLLELKGRGLQRVLIFAHGGVLICSKILAGKIDPKDAFNSLDDYGSIISIDL